jgi:uncharacterized protein HemX
MKLFKILGGILAAIAGIAGMLFAGGKKSQEVKELKTVIKENKKEEKKVEETIEVLEKDKVKNKKEITAAKRKLTRSKNEVKKMEKAYEEDDIESAEDFLKKFAKNK